MQHCEISFSVGPRHICPLGRGVIDSCSRSQLFEPRQRGPSFSKLLFDSAQIALCFRSGFFGFDSGGVGPIGSCVVYGYSALFCPQNLKLGLDTGKFCGLVLQVAIDAVTIRRQFVRL